jgi:membrane-bound lytic murein transglycosylase MltF
MYQESRFRDERITDEGERLKFILASYNTGAGHVEDAQRLASKYGGDPLAWSDVSYWLLQKSTQKYSADEVVKFGFCRGLEPVNYVEHILRRYEHYKEHVVARREQPKSRAKPRTSPGSAGIPARQSVREHASSQTL